MNAPHVPVFIIGYMACGKTTFGRALAKVLDRDFIDLDFRIEQRFHTTVSEIFRTRGEKEFRRIESDILREVAGMEDVVVACGGGTPCFNDNMDVIKSSGLSVWLDTSPEVITARLKVNRSRRPLMSSVKEEELMAGVRDGLKSRHQHYIRADVRISGDRLENRAQIADTVKAFMRDHGHFLTTRSMQE